MRIIIDSKVTDDGAECGGDHCNARGRIEGLPGWELTIGKRPEALLDAEGLAELAAHVGPDEVATLTPRGLHP